MMRDDSLVVAKFGGTSVQDTQALARLCTIVECEPRRQVVVVSALAGVTDDLCAVTGDGMAPNAALLELERLCTRHLDLAAAMISAAEGRALAASVRQYFESAAESVRQRHGPWTDPERDKILAIGELASSLIVTEVLRSAGVPGRWVDARQVIVTDSTFGLARPDVAAIRAAVQTRIRPLLASRYVPVMGGFVGATASGATTTLGRGGSDYTAALVAAALPAHELHIWTDVDGVCTADPRVVSAPQRVDRLSFDEAYDLARFGAKVLHPATVEPIAAQGIPARVVNARRPDDRGTRIAASGEARSRFVAGLAHRSGVTVADVHARGVAGSRRFLDSALTWLDAEGRRTTVVSLSPHRAVVASSDARSIAGFLQALHDTGHVYVAEDAGLVAVVGDQVAIKSQVWRVVEDLSGGTACPASSGHAIVTITFARQMTDLVSALHQRLCAGDRP